MTVAILLLGLVGSVLRAGFLYAVFVVQGILFLVHYRWLRSRARS